MMSSVASVGISPSSYLIFPIVYLAFYTNPCCSKMICMDGQISSIDLLISTQIFSLAWAKVCAMIVSFCNYCSC
jgi:hypothetical protein